MARGHRIWACRGEGWESVNPFQPGESTAFGLLKPFASVLMGTVLLCPEDLYRKLEYTLGLPTLPRVEVTEKLVVRTHHHNY